MKRVLFLAVLISIIGCQKTSKDSSMTVSSSDSTNVKIDSLMASDLKVDSAKIKLEDSLKVNPRNKKM